MVKNDNEMKIREKSKQDRKKILLGLGAIFRFNFMFPRLMSHYIDKLCPILWFCWVKVTS